MAAKKKEEAPKGSPAWMATFSDLMNLLLCFFVLLFSMSTVDAEKFEMVIASLQSSFSILPSGGSSVSEDGELISSGISALEMFDDYLNLSVEMPEDDGDSELNAQTGDYDVEDAKDYEASANDVMTAEEALEVVEEAGLAESEAMAEEIEELLVQYNMADSVDIEFNEQYVLLNLNGALLFESGQYTVRTEAEPILEKICIILGMYTDSLIEVEGHTDNVPMNSATMTNDELSMYRALSVAYYIRENAGIDASHVKYSGRGEYSPIADNSTAEGRALNRRVEIKIYNSLYSTGIN